MRTFSFVIALLLVVTQLPAQTKIHSKAAGDMEVNELDHGLARVEAGTEDATHATPTGTHGWLKDLVITQVTDSIHIQPKANFGVVYQMTTRDTVELPVDIEWIYPGKVTNEKGETFRSIRYTTRRPTNIPSASSYSLDAPYEMVPGRWTLNLYVEGKKVLTHTFVLYR
jgi:hypothetical protein